MEGLGQEYMPLDRPWGGGSSKGRGKSRRSRDGQMTSLNTKSTAPRPEPTFDRYQAEAAEIVKYPRQGQHGWESITHAMLGMAETAGQVAGRVSAMAREGVWKPFTGGKGLANNITHYEEAREELGQVLWYAGA